MTTPTVTFSPVNIEKRKETDIRTGDTIRVHTKIIEKGKTRTQPFEGLVIARKHGAEPGATFTVRRTSEGYGVEKIFPLYSPNIDKIEILRRSKVRQSNIYHVREKVAKQIRREMRRMMLMGELAFSESEEQEATKAEEAVAAPTSQDESEPRPEGVGEAAEEATTNETQSETQPDESPVEEKQSGGEETKE
ncbi:MAG: 50S ribosomal protein L19 [Candidatus Paceibacterota bacterium]